MGQGMELALAAPEAATTPEERVESEFLVCLVAQAGAVMCASKPAAVFNFVPRQRDDADAARTMALALEAAQTYARSMRAYGMELRVVCPMPGRVALLAWRPAAVERILSSEDNRAFLADFGYDTSSTEAYVTCTLERLRAYNEALRRHQACRGCSCEACSQLPFPHEIGLLLGYPLDDVRGFIANHGHGCTERGVWKVYGNENAARAQFARIKDDERRCMRLFRQGSPLRDLLVLGAA